MTNFFTKKFVALAILAAAFSSYAMKTEKKLSLKEKIKMKRRQRSGETLIIDLKTYKSNKKNTEQKPQIIQKMARETEEKK